MEKNSSIPYQYLQESEGYFQFTANNNVEYLVYFEKQIQELFKSSYPNFSYYFFEFGFVPVDKTIEEIKNYPKDERIITTVVQILKEYFEHNQNAIIYNCLANDGKQGVRSRYFDTIFQKVRQNEILKFNSFIGLENDVQYFQSLLIRKDNPDLEYLVEAFYSIVNILG